MNLYDLYNLLATVFPDCEIGEDHGRQLIVYTNKTVDDDGNVVDFAESEVTFDTEG